LGAGLVLNTAAVDVLVKEFIGEGENGKECRPNQVGSWEDVTVAYCLNEEGVKVYNGTEDELGRKHLLPFTPDSHLSYRIPSVFPSRYAMYTKDWRLKFLHEGLEAQVWA